MINNEIVLKAMSKDNEAFEALYYETYSEIYAITYRMTGNKDDAEDLLQSSYLNAFKNIDTLKDPSNFESWLKKIAYNQCKNFLAKKKPMLFSAFENDKGIDFEDTLEDIASKKSEEIAVENDTKEIIGEILTSLPEDQRLCVIMYYADEMKVSEIAQAVGIPVNTVKSRLSYGRKKIKDQVLSYERKGYVLRAGAPLSMYTIVKTALNIGTIHATNPAGLIAAASGSAASAGVTASTAGVVAAKAGISLGAKIGMAIAGVGIVATGTVAGIAISRNTTENISGTPTASETSIASEVFESTTEMPTEAVDSAWEDAYRDLILEGNYQDLPFLSQKSIENESFAVCDLDQNGTQELLVSYKTPASNPKPLNKSSAIYIYNYNNKAVQYTEKISCSGSDTILLSVLKGESIFFNVNNTPTGGTRCYAYSFDSDMLLKETFVGDINTASNSPQSFTRTEDDQLFDCAVNANHQVVFYTIDEIQNMGWDSFINNCVTEKENAFARVYETTDKNNVVYNNNLQADQSNILEFRQFRLRLELNDDYLKYTSNTFNAGAGGEKYTVYLLFKDNYLVDLLGEQDERSALFKIEHRATSDLNPGEIMIGRGETGKMYYVYHPYEYEDIEGVPDAVMKRHKRLLEEAEEIISTIEIL